MDSTNMYESYANIFLYFREKGWAQCNVRWYVKTNLGLRLSGTIFCPSGQSDCSLFGLSSSMRS